MLNPPMTLWQTFPPANRQQLLRILSQMLNRQVGASTQQEVSDDVE